MTATGTEQHQAEADIRQSSQPAGLTLMNDEQRHRLAIYRLAGVA
jgi:hypothetical protein